MQSTLVLLRWPTVTITKGRTTTEKLKDTGYAEFADQDAARVFLTTAGKVVEVQGAAVSVSKAKTKFAKQRDWVLYTAKDKLKEEAPEQEVEVTTDRGRRAVTVGSEEAFVQGKDEAKGSFVGDFARLSLPQ